MADDDDDMVTLVVPNLTKREVKVLAEEGFGPLAAAARAWVAANDRPERRVFVLAHEDGVLDPDVIRCSHAVAVEDLRPGDRVAEREVRLKPRRIAVGLNQRVQVSWMDGTHSDGFPGSLVVLDPEGDR